MHRFEVGNTVTLTLSFKLHILDGGSTGGHTWAFTTGRGNGFHPEASGHYWVGCDEKRRSCVSTKEVKKVQPIMRRRNSFTRTPVPEE